jgi:fatty-acyl-CoA synthase
LTDADGRALPEQRNAEGHLRVRGASVIGRYFGDECPATDANGWFNTGDLARIDTQGNLMITGGAKHLIKSGGEWLCVPKMPLGLTGKIDKLRLRAQYGSG